MKRIPILIFIIFGVVLISGCASQTNKHFDNQVLAFDYPSNLQVKEDQFNGWIIHVTDNEGNGCTISYVKPVINITMEDYVNRNFRNNSNVTQLNKTTISGKPAYNIVKNENEMIVYETVIEYGEGYILIAPVVEANTKNSIETTGYKAYNTIVNSIKIY